MVTQALDNWEGELIGPNLKKRQELVLKIGKYSSLVVSWFTNSRNRIRRRKDETISELVCPCCETDVEYDDNGRRVYLYAYQINEVDDESSDNESSDNNSWLDFILL